MITIVLWVSVGLPMAAALAIASVPISNERWVSRIVQASTAASALASLAAITLWLLAGEANFATSPRDLFAHGAYRFTFELTLDAVAAVFLMLVQFITGMVVRFSRFYMHREPGFRRFFATVLLFQGGMCMLTLAGNLQVMFAAWEIVGVASFLLIAFYRERQSAVRNALRTYSVYRTADVGMLLAACLEASGGSREIGFLLLLAAVGKSAQFPFCFWVPRAMEGPTPSSALFYGGLSVHAGAYLLLRTFDVWRDVIAVRWSVGAVGLVTAVLCSMFSRVQPTIKGQLGYASVTQVGIIFVEIALGLEVLGLTHLVANALFRSYQLLVSPSAVAYVLRRHATAGAPSTSEARSFYARHLSHSARSTLYAFALNEGYLKDLVKAVMWVPLRKLGRAALPHGRSIVILGACAAIATWTLLPRVSERGGLALGSLLLVVALACSSCALSAWRRPVQAFGWVWGSSVASALAAFAVVPSHAGFASESDALFVGLSAALAVVGTALVVPRGEQIRRFAGFAETHSLAAACALLGALGIAGFPLLPTFVGEDLLLHATLPVSRTFSFFLAGMLALNGYLAVRTFALTFFGRRAVVTHDQRTGHLVLESDGASGGAVALRVEARLAEDH